MPTVRYTGSSGYAIRDGPTFDEDTREASVSPREADRLTDRHDFELVDADASDGGAETAGGAADGFEADAWLEQDYQTRADRVAAGEVDAHLDEVHEAETSQTVKDGVDERRDELE